MNKHIIFIFSLVLLFTSFVIPASAEEKHRGQILKVDGDVQIINIKCESRRIVDGKYLLREMDTVVTHRGGKAVVQFTDGALSILNEKSSLRIEKSNWLSHLGGKIYFTFRKVFGKTKKIKSRFATIGIRGTTFIVYDDTKGQSVALQEGELELESPGEEYEIHRQREMNEFEAFKQAARDKQAVLQQEYDNYKKQTMQEFVEYKQSFMLEANRVVRFDGNRVDETEIDDKVKADFSDFESIAGEMLKEFRRQSKEQREKLDD